MIVTHDLTKTYQLADVAVHALAGVSLTIEEGDFVAVMGASGSGKSTLMYILGCLDTPTNGEYLLDGVPVTGMSDDELAEIRNHRIGFVFQSYNLLPRMPAIAQVELPLLYRSASNRRQLAEEALVSVGLADRLHHRPTEMSGGQQQRVGIARAIVADPSLILADEPTGNLDSKTSAEILDIFEELNAERGKTILLVTHEREVAARCRRVITMRDGLVIADDVRPTARALRALAA
jgi:putative ABC transport system ATP-binding protein